MATGEAKAPVPYVPGAASPMRVTSRGFPRFLVALATSRQLLPWAPTVVLYLQSYFILGYGT